MFARSVYWLGIIACIALIISCFLPWAFYADINQQFTGFYSYLNKYGKPGKLMLVLGTIVLVFMLLPKVWAKRANLFICAMLLAYAVKSYILFGSCYNNYCPEKQFGLYLMLGSSAVMMLAAVLPKMKM